MSQRSIATLVASIAVCAWTCPARADAGVHEDAGEVRCQTSDDCAPPNPYCSPTLSKCVQCIADLNCFGVGLVCDQELGVCTNCRTNADCYASAPYCSRALKTCVECLTDGNCGKQGIKCMNGVCGSCGDGICSDNERNGLFGPCNDCFAGCPKTDLRSKTGDNVSSGPLSSTDGQFTTSCATPQGPAATFAWTAPDNGSYTFTVSGDATLSIYDTNCAGQPFSCGNYYAGLYLSKDQKVAIIVGSSTLAGGKYSLSINGSSPMTCNPMFCPVGINGEAPCCLGDMTCGFVDPTFGCSTMTAPPGSAGGTGSAGPKGPPPDSTPQGGNGSGAVPGTIIGGTGTGGRQVGAGGVRGGATSTDQDAGSDAHHRSTTTSGGCGCSVPGNDESAEGALASFAAAGLLAFARRRRGAAASR